MKKTIPGLLVCLTFVLVLLSSCASTFEQAGAALEQGDYTTAIVKSLESIGKGKDVAEAEAVLKDAWKRANSEWNAQIATIEQATTADELAKAIPLYNKLLEIHKLVAAAGRTELKSDREAVLQKALQTQQRLAEMYFKEASATLALGGRENARKAVFQYRKVKNLAPTYPDIDRTIEQATKQATVKVYVSSDPDKNSSFTNYKMQSMVEQQLSAMDFVEVVKPATSYTERELIDHLATDIARSLGADTVLSFRPNTSYSSGPRQEKRPIDSRVTSAADWEIAKIYMLTSGKCEVLYNIVDVETEKVLAEGTFLVEDSTDYGFSVSAILHQGKKANLQIGNMSSRETLLVNDLAPGVSETNLAMQLQVYEKIDMGPTYANGLAPARYGTFDPIDFNQYKTPDQLAKIQDLNGHTFVLFDVTETTIKYGKDEQKSYGSLYGQYFGEGFAAEVKTAQFDRQVYNDLRAWMGNRNTQNAIREAFIGEFLTKTVPNRIAEKVAPALK
ncbi:MAG: hypothetical protein EOM68_03275 [Spirochaetia bacterium]|nr:hypothetical protein [Spirochaetia bacterium]